VIQNLHPADSLEGKSGENRRRQLAAGGGFLPLLEILETSGDRTTPRFRRIGSANYTQNV
jgi:hypothetical protein